MDLQRRNTFLLQLFCNFATIAQYICYGVSGEVSVNVSGEVSVDISDEIDLATIAQFFCYKVSGESPVRSPTSSSFSFIPWVNRFLLH